MALDGGREPHTHNGESGGSVWGFHFMRSEYENQTHLKYDSLRVWYTGCLLLTGMRIHSIRYCIEE